MDMEDEKLIELFNSLPAETQKAVIRFFKFLSYCFCQDPET